MVSSAGPAFAEKGVSTSAKEKAAKKACALGDYQKGAEILADLFVETNDPTYIYNQARCYQQNGIWEQALLRFREHLRKAKNLSDSDRAETERQISDCEASLRQSTPVGASPAPTSPQVAHAEAQPAVPTAEIAHPAVPAAPTPQPPDGGKAKRLRTAGIVCAAVGLAAVATGVGLALKTQSISSDEQQHVATVDKENQRKSLETWGWVSYGFGAAAIATGAVLYIVGWPSNQTSSVALLPALSPEGASMMLKGSF
jgi:tetratricopeptide (TPR) repeat protein